MDAPFLDGDESPVTRFSYGAGEVIWWSTADPMSNSGIREKDNAQLLLNSVGDAGRGPVLWDEYFHQGGKTVVDSVLASPLRWALLQAALIGALVCLTYSRRFGPARQSVAASRLAPMEFVETLAALYQKSGAAHIAVEIVYEQFRGALATPLLGSHRCRCRAGRRGHRRSSSGSQRPPKITGADSPHRRRGGESRAAGGGSNRG